MQTGRGKPEVGGVGGPADLPADAGCPQQLPHLPYACPSISEEEIQAVAEVLRSRWLTTGPMVSQFERAFARYVGAAEAVAVSSGTAALHAAMSAAGIGPGDEVIVPAMTFVATANSVVYQGGTPVFADVDPETLLLGPAEAAAKLSRHTKGIVGVDYAGQPCDYAALGELAREHQLTLLADASHSLGGRDRRRPVGRLADLSTFSLHAIKAVAAGEGGVVTTDDCRWAQRMRRFRNHGFGRDHRQRTGQRSWHYEMIELGYNYRLTDIQCALAFGQLAKLDAQVARRREIAQLYDQLLVDLPGIRPLRMRSEVEHARHLYVVRVDPQALGADRDSLFDVLRRAGIAAAVHFPPVHLHPFYRARFGTSTGMCPVAERAYQEILSLPIFPSMTDADVHRVVGALHAAAEGPSVGRRRLHVGGCRRASGNTRVRTGCAAHTGNGAAQDRLGEDPRR